MAIEVPELVKTYLRAVLLSATKGKGIPEKELERDYKKMAGETLKWKELGFAHLFDFLEAVPDVARMEWSDKDNQNRVFGVGDPNAFFMSLHAQKAQGKPNSAKPPKTPEMQRKMVGAAAPKSPGRHVSPEGFVAGPRGLYAIYINNLPPGCHQVLAKQWLFVLTSQILQIAGGWGGGGDPRQENFWCIQKFGGIKGLVVRGFSFLTHSARIID